MFTCDNDSFSISDLIKTSQLYVPEYFVLCPQKVKFDIFKQNLLKSYTGELSGQASNPSWEYGKAPDRFWCPKSTTV